ncbi:armadillo-type protein [Lipomyces chichibuensis]|uniref:armadillo-type protein n=1 Tax=Lipomyces chichibuensis TaxID=1546026 RepID=UPI003344310C
MSSLPAEATAALLALLQSLTSPDNNTRSTAETSLNAEWISQRLDFLMLGLAEQMLMSEDQTLRSFSAVLFRRIAAKQPDDSEVLTSRLVDKLTPEVKAKIKEILLQALSNEQVNDTRHKICDTISELTFGTSDRWPELLEVLFQATKSPAAGLREAAFRIFAASPTIISKQHLPAVANVFREAFQDPSEDVRIGAIVAYTALFETLNKSSWPTLQPLLPDLLNVLPPLNTPEKSDQLTSTLSPLLDLAALAPKLFRPMFKTVVDFGISVIKNKEMESTARQTALELLTTFADEAPGMCKKEPTYATSMVVQSLAMMTEVGEDDDDVATAWREDDDLDSDDADSTHVAARQSLDRLAVKLGGTTLLPPLFQWLPQMVASSNWQERHAALMAISAFAEGCRDVMMSELSKVLDMVLPLLQDPHPRVQWAACNAVGQMSTDFADDLQRQFGDHVLPALIHVLESPEPRVQAHGAAALVNFCEEAEKETLEPFLDNLLSHLMVLLQSPKKYVQEQVLTTIAIVADAAETKFAKYYDTMMPILFNVLQSDTGKEYRVLKAKCIECSSLIALAVGREKFSGLSQQLIHTYATIQSSITDSDDPAASYLIQAWGRICRVLGKDFLPFLGGVMPPLLEVGKTKPELQLIDDAADAENFDQEGWDLVPVQGKHIGIRTSLLEDKCTAIELLSIYASELGGGFEPYVAEILNDIVLPSLSFFFHDGVRIAAAQAIPHLLSAVKDSGPANTAKLAEYWRQIVTKLLEALTNEPFVELLTCFYTTLYQSIETIGIHSLTQDDMEKFVQSIISNMGDYLERVKSRSGQEDEYEDYAEEDKDEDMLIDEELVSEVNKAIHSVFKAQRTSFLPNFEKLLPLLTELVARAEVECREFSICVFDDLIEFCGPDAWRYQEVYLQPLATVLNDQNAALRQASAYGFGVAAQFGGEAFATIVASVVPHLFAIIGVPDARNEENVHATENASAAIAKILRFNGSQVANVDTVIDAWIQTLPIVNDEEAAPYAYSFLVDLIEQHHPAIPNHIPHILESVKKALDAKSLQGATAERVIRAVQG